MAKPTIYKWTDPGAPQITPGNMLEVQALFQAVLIDGYGTKNPPGTGATGWSIPFSDASSFILKQGGSSDHKCCLKLEMKSSGYANMQVALDYTDLSTPVSMWGGQSTNERVGMGAASTGYHIPWIIFATKRTILCQFGYNTQSTDVDVFDTSLSANALNYHWMFGDFPQEGGQTIQNPHFIIGTDQSSTSSQYYRATLTSNLSSYSYKRCYTDLGGQPMIPLVTTPMGVESNWIARPGVGLPSYPNYLNGGIYLQKAKFMVHNTIIGTIPGIVYSTQERIPQMGGDIKTITGSGEFDGMTLYVFNTYLGQYMVHDGDWGVE